MSTMGYDALKAAVAITIVVVLSGKLRRQFAAMPADEQVRTKRNVLAGLLAAAAFSAAAVIYFLQTPSS